MDKKRMKKMVLAAIMVALVIIATMFLKIPIFTGYIHLGDTIIYLAGILGGPYALFVGGVGTALADILGGYVIYAIPSLIGHGVQGLLFAVLYKRKQGLTTFQFILGAFIIGLFTVIPTYLIADIAFYGQPTTALISAGFNVIQVGVGSILAGLLFRPLEKWLKN